MGMERLFVARIRLVIEPEYGVSVDDYAFEVQLQRLPVEKNDRNALQAGPAACFDMSLQQALSRLMIRVTIEHEFALWIVHEIQNRVVVAERPVKDYVGALFRFCCWRHGSISLDG